jgi:hypothetical protein
MRNHYHVLLETPAGNLVAGMKWVQGTHTLRFNARERCPHPGSPILHFSRHLTPFIGVRPVGSVSSLGSKGHTPSSQLVVVAEDPEVRLILGDGNGNAA